VAAETVEASVTFRALYLAKASVRGRFREVSLQLFPEQLVPHNRRARYKQQRRGAQDANIVLGAARALPYLGISFAQTDLKMTVPKLFVSPDV